MGASYEESSDAIKHVRYNIVNENNKPYVDVNGKNFSAEEISSMIIGKMKKLLKTISVKKLKTLL